MVDLEPLSPSQRARSLVKDRRRAVRIGRLWKALIMAPVALSDLIAVGEMPTPEGVAILAQAGFRSILNAQPDGEVARHLMGAELHTEARQRGLAYAYVPAESRRPDEATIAAFRRALNELPKPIYACCYSGARSAALWALAMAGQIPPAKLQDACGGAGYDISSLHEELAERHAGLEPARMRTKTEPLMAPDRASSDLAIITPRAASVGGFSVPG